MENDCSASGAIVPALKIVPAVSTLTATGDVESPLAISISPAEPRATDVTAHVIWASSNSAVATVNASGQIAAVGPGKAVITATQKLPDGATISGTQTVEVATATQSQ